MIYSMKNLFPYSLSLVTLVTLLGAPLAASAQSILLSSGNFTILAGTSISSTNVVGTNIISGNIGLSPTSGTAITGFPPAIITGGGGIIPTGPVTAQAMTDLMAVATGLANMPANVNMSDLDLGGTTLLPGVYKFDAAAAMNGILTLDANGQNNAFWVFQIASTLTTTNGSTVNIINLGSNGGSDDGIYWATGAAINVGNSNVIAGNYLAGTTITFGTNTNGNGRALARAAVVLDQNVINSQGGPAGSDWTGGLRYNNAGDVVPVPEPAAFLWFVPLAALGLVLWQRRTAVGKQMAV